jgi:hypothetical protein
VARGNRGKIETDFKTFPVATALRAVRFDIRF